MKQVTYIRTCTESNVIPVSSVLGTRFYKVVVPEIYGITSSPTRSYQLIHCFAWGNSQQLGNLISKNSLCYALQDLHDDGMSYMLRGDSLACTISCLLENPGVSVYEYMSQKELRGTAPIIGLNKVMLDDKVKYRHVFSEIKEEDFLILGDPKTDDVYTPVKANSSDSCWYLYNVKQHRIVSNSFISCVSLQSAVVERYIELGLITPSHVFTCTWIELMDMTAKKGAR